MKHPVRYEDAKPGNYYKDDSTYIRYHYVWSVDHLRPWVVKLMPEYGGKYVVVDGALGEAGEEPEISEHFDTFEDAVVLAYALAKLMPDNIGALHP